MVKLLALEGGPTRFSLASAFSSIPPNLNKNDHFLIVQTLLRGGAQGPEITEALHASVISHHKSPRLVELLVQFGAVVANETLFACVSHGATDILDILITGNVTPTSCAEAITIAVKVHNGGIRYRIVKILLGSATSVGPDVPPIANAVIEILRNCPDDIKLLALLCREGKANANHENGLAVVLSTRLADPVILDIVLRGEGAAPNLSTIERGLQSAIDLPPTDANRQIKVEALLWRSKPQDAMDQVLIKEIKSALATKQDLGMIKVLLAAGADVNSYDATAISLSVSDADIMDLVIAKGPSLKSLSAAFRSAMALRDPARHLMCEKLLKAGATGEEISRGLCTAAKEGPPALPLMKLLLPYADVNFRDGRVFRLVVSKGFSEAMDLLLSSQKSRATPETTACVFQEALKLKDRDERLKMAQRLLKFGISEPTISDGLITAVSLGDRELVDLLLQCGASVESKNGAAVHAAASSGHHEMLKLLVERKPTLSTLTSGFGGASASKNQPDAYYLVLKTLLDAGMRGEAIDAALVEAIQGGEQNVKIAELLFNAGASLEWREGEALAIATRSGSIRTVKVLLERTAPQHVLTRSWKLAIQLPRDQRCEVMEILLLAGKAIDGHVSKALIAATKESPADRKLIKTILSSGGFDAGESMVCAAQSLDLRTLTLLANSPKAPKFISTAFKDAMSTGSLWQSATGLAIVELMLKKGASGDAVGEALCLAVEKSESGTEVLAADFLEVFLRYGADANYQQGLVLQRAARNVDVDLIEKLLPSANVESKAMSMPYLFFSTGDKANVQRALEAFSDSYSGEERDEVVLFKHPDVELQPILFQALEKYPRDTTILRSLLNIGYNPNQWKLRGQDINTEPWPILCWALDQPEKKISTAVTEMLIDEGANINFRSKSGITPLALAIQNQRADIVLKLLNKGARVTEPDAEGITPLNLAGSLTNTDIMGYILQAGAETDDGSLHDVARQLRCDAMRTLIKNGHEVDYPSDRHEGRSALAELCLRAMDNSPSPAELEEAIQCLIVNDANIREVSFSGKTIFHYALDSSNPVTILAVLLKMMWKFINEDAFLFSDNKYTYSLTKYVEKGLFGGPPHQKQELLQLLRNKRAKDRFWANSIDEVQPEDYCNGPSHIEAEVLLQKSRLKRQVEQREDVQRLLELKRATVIGEVEIMRIMTEAEIGRERQKGLVERELLTEKANTQMQLDMAADVQKDKMLKQKYLRDEGHKRQLRDIQVSTQRAIMAEESEKERARSVMQIEFMEKRTQIENAAMRERAEIENNGSRTRLAIEGSAFQEHERVLAKQHDRELARIKMQKQLVASQTTLAGTFQGAGLNQRQIGYITEA
ncbi:putative ankyrin repeat protein [Cadophora sp. DSE1049]|nr:putative ankyrin repeat protein [Cadophora sp. DSE1049]